MGRFVAQALAGAVLLENYAKSVIELYICVLETDGDCAALAASVTAGSLALADAGIAMRDMVTATSVCRIDGQLLTDCTHEEESKADMTFVAAKLAGSDMLTHVHHAGVLSDLAVISRMVTDCSEMCTKIATVVKTS